MKIRTSFVSNSSSSSFIIMKRYLTSKQIREIRHHCDTSINFSDAWEITEDEYEISGKTWMDNFDMRRHLEKIGVDMSKVEWDE